MKFETKYANRIPSQFDLRKLDVGTLNDLVPLEEHVLQFWEEVNLEEMVKDKNRGREKFSFFDGPVTANNPLGVHHAWGRTLKDVVLRYKALQGYDQRLQYGFDTQGLWVEVEVEKALGFNSKKELEKFGVDQFVNEGKARVQKYSQVQDRQSLRLGMLKSKDSYFTHSDENVSAIWQFLATANQNGWLYKGHRPMPWCTRCGTSLSAHEQADSYLEVTHDSLYVKFKINELVDTYFLVWTTTPWTLPVNQAVAVHPELEYGLFRTPTGEKYLVGVWMDESLMQDSKLEKTYLGTELLNYTYTHPFHNLEAQKQLSYGVVSWEDVSTSEGTGVVHLAPGCGREDYELLKGTLLILSPLDEAGYYGNGFGSFSGKNYKEVNLLAVELLKQSGDLFRKVPYAHRYPHCWRCKTELVYRLVGEWFLSVDDLRIKLLDAADVINWNPEYTRKLFQDWVENMEDWCISRKRYWGLPLPFYECECGHLTVVSSKEEFLGNAVDNVKALQELHLPWIDQLKYPCNSCGTLLTRVSEVGDCWLDAGIMPFSTLGYFSGHREEWNKWFPAEFVCEMREQVRLWFYSMMTLSVTLVGRAPFRTVLSYEKVKDKNNQEMHKTGKNNVVLDDALNRLGADALRLYYLSQSRSSNMRFDFEVGENLGRLLLTLYHSFKFFLTYADLDGFVYEPDLASINLDDRWMLSRLGYYHNSLTEAMNNYHFGSVMELLEESVSDLSTWYLRQVRTRVWQKDLEVYNTLFVVFRLFAVLLAPFTPFMSELLYQNLKQFSTQLLLSVHLENLDHFSKYDPELDHEVSLVRKLVELGRRLREQNQVKSRHPLKAAYYWYRGVRPLSPELKALLSTNLNVKSVESLDDPSKFVSICLLPKYDLLGPKFGPEVSQVAKLLRNVNTEEAMALLSGNRSKLNLESYELEVGELDVRLERNGPYHLEYEGDILLLVDFNRDANLLGEALVRDFSREIQVYRKELQLPVDQKVKLVLSGNPFLFERLKEFKNELMDQLQLSDLKFSKDNPPLREFQSQGEVYGYSLVVNSN